MHIQQNQQIAHAAPFAPFFPGMAQTIASRAAAEIRKADARARWSDIAKAPGLICVRREDGSLTVAFDGGIPKAGTPDSMLGHGGEVYAVYGTDGSVRATCNLWSVQTVPAEFADLFAPNARGFKRVSGRGIPGLAAAREVIASAEKTRKGVAL